MLKGFRLWLLEQRLRLHSGKYEAYQNEIRRKGLQTDYPACLRLASELLREPEFSRMRSWAEYQRMKNAGEN